jgi:sarcosine oxidase
LQRYAREWLPGTNPDEFDTISCTYTTTPDSNFVLDRFGPIVIGAGFSGHGFKFTPAIGRMLADLADGIGSAPKLFAAAR